MQMTSESLTSPLKWVGGKRLLVPTLKPYYDKFRHCRLVEPFCGSLAIALGLQPERALLNDANPHLINLYRCIQKGVKLDFPTVNTEEAYLHFRSEFNQVGIYTPIERKAALFYYLNQSGYNGLCRFNKNGGFNVPFGKRAKLKLDHDFTALENQFSLWRFANSDFQNLKTTDNDFIYADPPYDTPFTNYCEEGFDWQDQVRCARWLAAKQCPVIASNQATDRIVKLYLELGFEIQFIDARRSISCNGDRAKAKEILAFKNLDMEKMHYE
jgi:DNA adenine methylase